MTIKKVGSKFQLISATGKNLGTFPTKAAAEKREKQVKFFKNTKKADSPVRLREFKKHLSESVGNDYDLNDDDQREAASCLYIAVEELEREDKLRRIAADGDQTLEELMVNAKPELDGGVPVDLASGYAQASMLVIERKRTSLETGNLQGMVPTGYTNEHDHMYNSLVAGFTTPDPVDGHSHWVDVRDESTHAAGMGFHIHTTQPFEVQRDDLIVFEDEMAQRSDFGGITLSERDMGESETDFNGLFTGVNRQEEGNGKPAFLNKKKKEETKEQTKATDARRGLPLTTRERERGNPLDSLSTRESRARQEAKKKEKKAPYNRSGEAVRET